MPVFVRNSIDDARRLAESRSGKCLDSSYESAHSKMRWQCSLGHKFEMRYYCVHNGQWCPKCANKKKGRSQRLTRKGVEEILKSSGFRLVDQDFVYKNYTSKVNGSCLSCGTVVRSTLSVFNAGRQCAKCVYVAKENEILKIIKDKKGELVSGKYPDFEVSCSSGHKWKTKARNLKSGYWCRVCGVEAAKKSREMTFLKKYGVPHNMQDKETLAKAAKALNSSTSLPHWKTGEELVCVGSYERKAVEWLNENKYNFLWQPGGFELPNNSFYFPDAYLLDKGTYVEIKGFFRKDAKEKWEWFHENYPNSELWDKNKLKELNIL